MKNWTIYIWRNFIDFWFPSISRRHKRLRDHHDHREGLLEKEVPIFYASSCRLGVALPMLHGVYCFRRRVVLCSSTSEVRAKCIREWRMISDNGARANALARCEIRTEAYIFCERRGRAWGFYAHYSRRRICIFKKIIAREYNLSQTCHHRHAVVVTLCLGTGRRIPPKIITIYIITMIVFNCVSLSYHISFVK